MTSVRSMTDLAYEIMSKKKRAIMFSKLWEDVKKAFGASDDAISQFYSDLTLDSRFVRMKEENKWDLVERRKYAESHVDLSNIELDEDDPEEEDEDEEEDVIKEEDAY